MPDHLTQWIDIYEFSTGRRLFVHRQVQETLAKGPPFAKLDQHLARARDHDQKTRLAEGHWQQAKQHKDRPSAQRAEVIDAQVDRTVGGIERAARNIIQSSDPLDPVVALAQHFLDERFPNGLAAIVHLPFVEELAAVDDLLSYLAKPENAGLLTELGIGRLVQRLAGLAEQYRTALAQDLAAVQYKDVVAMQARGQDLLRQTVAIILGEYHDGQDPAHLSARTPLLKPLYAQQQQIAEYRRRRRRVPDIDPDTGHEVPTSATAVQTEEG